MKFTLTPISVCYVYYYALFRILSSTGAFGIFLLVKTSITGPSSSDLLMTAGEEAMLTFSTS